MLRIALPNKGRLAEEARELFNDAGLEVRVRGDRALTASLGGEFEAIFVRAQDIPEFVADGAADAGVTGWDLVCESERRPSSSDGTRLLDAVNRTDRISMSGVHPGLQFVQPECLHRPCRPRPTARDRSRLPRSDT